MEINNCFLQMQNPNGVKDLLGVEVFKQARWREHCPPSWGAPCGRKVHRVGKQGYLPKVDG